LIIKKLRLNCYESRLLPKTASATEYEFRFSVIDYSLVGKPEEKYETKHYIIKTGIDELLAKIWKLNRLEDIEKVLYEHSKLNVIEKLKRLTLKEREELEYLFAYKYQNFRPSKFDPSRIPEPGQRSFDIEIMIK